MSSFGTSVINKSSKNYTPKAPARRNRPSKAPSPPPAPPSSSQTERIQTPITPSQNQTSTTSNPSEPTASQHTRTDAPSDAQPYNTLETTVHSQAQGNTTEEATSPKRTRRAESLDLHSRKRQRTNEDSLDARHESRPIEGSPNNAQPTPVDVSLGQVSANVSYEIGEARTGNVNQERPSQSIRQRVAARAKARKQARQEADDRAAQEASHQVARASVNGSLAVRNNPVDQSARSGSGENTSSRPAQQQTEVAQATLNDTSESENAAPRRATIDTAARKRRGRPRKDASEVPSHSGSATLPTQQAESTRADERAGDPNEPTPTVEQSSSDRERNIRQGPTSNTQSNTISPPKRKKKSTANRKSRTTGADGEKHEIDAGVLSMNDLSKDSRRGKVSGLETRMQNVDWGKVIAQRKAAEREALERAAAAQESQQNGNDPEMDEQIEDTENPVVQGDNEAVNERLDRAEAAAADARYAGPRLKVVDGQMVVDDSTRTVDRYAENPEIDATTGAALEEIEEDDITRRINRQSWLHASRRDPLERRVSNKSDPWTSAQTNSFYDALRMFGTDFYIISRMFVGKTRRHIKLKFNREEKANPDRIRAALLGGSVPMDMQVYQQRTGKAEGYYKDPEILKRELAEADERQRTEIEKQKEEEREAAQKKMDAARERQEAAKRGRRGRRKVGTADGADVTETMAESVQAAA